DDAVGGGAEPRAVQAVDDDAGHGVGGAVGDSGRLPCAVLEDAGATGGGGPDASAAVAAEVPDGAGGDALAGAEGLQATVAQVEETGAVGANPEAGAVVDECSQATGGEVDAVDDAGGLELEAVEAGKALPRGHPQVSAFILGQARHGVLGQAVADGPGVGLDVL